ncbi:MAG: A/G-specific adenine glycosylase [Fimbriimonadaceae bacterium]|nr:A/G-specific adenine glycosylase [Fimbriimonadaceae bacterium]
MSDWRRRLLVWYDANRRDLPWRESRDPYAVWVSEAMLQQTTVATVLPFYARWMARFPTVGALAQAEIDEALALWSGLGYYRRCRMLHEAARRVTDEGWPATAQEWRRLPGVGAYTAAALASIVSNEPSAVVDGNVVRVYARLNNDPATGTNLHRAAQKWADRVIDRELPGEWNQAVMELGATVCRPSGPKCGDCPVSDVCQAFAAGTAGSLPTKAPKPLSIRLSSTMVVPVSFGKVGFTKITEGPWWRGLWECPQGESPEAWIGRLRPETVEPAGAFVFVVTRHRISLEVLVASGCEQTGDLEWEPWSRTDRLPLTSPTRRALALPPVVRLAGKEAPVHRPTHERHRR